MKLFLLQHEWLTIPLQTRLLLSARFQIGKSEPTHIVNNVLMSDGTSQRDLKNLSLGVMIDYLKDLVPWAHDNLYDELLNITICKLTGSEMPPLGKVPCDLCNGMKEKIGDLEGKLHAEKTALSEAQQKIFDLQGQINLLTTSHGAEDPLPKRKGRPPKKKTDL